MKKPSDKIYSKKDCLKNLSKFPLGLELLKTGSFNTLWTEHVLNIKNSNLNFENPLEKFIYIDSYFVAAWKWVELKYQDLIKENLQKNQVIASIPGGSLQEFLCLDLNKYENLTILAVDIDSNSLKQSLENALKYNLKHKLILERKDALKLEFNQEIDLISSCGLNIYIDKTDARALLLQNFGKSLKKGGKLIFSYLTYPPGFGNKTDWLVEKMNLSLIDFEIFLFRNVLQAKWLNFSSDEEVLSQLKSAGFENIQIFRDPFNVFPVVKAFKS